MWYGTIAYNLEYAGASSLRWNSTISVLQGLLGFSVVICSLVVGIILVFFGGNHRKHGCIWFFSAGMLLVYLFNTNGFLHYGLIAAPLLPVILLEFNHLFSCVNRGIKCVALRCIYLLLCIALLGSGALGIKNTLSAYYYEYYRIARGVDVEPNEAAVSLVKKIPQEELTSFAAYNCKDGLYLHLDACPEYRFFTMQDWAAKCSTTLKPKILDEYRNGNAKWVLFATGSDQDVYEIIQSRYTLWDQVQIPYSKEYYQLFKLNE